MTTIQMLRKKLTEIATDIFKPEEVPDDPAPGKTELEIYIDNNKELITQAVKNNE